MTGTDIFNWHPAAQLFGARHEIPRSTSQGGCSGFQALPAAPTDAALQALSHQLVRGPFLLANEPFSPQSPLPATHFATLSGGASGRSKVILRSQQSWIASFEINAERFGMRRGERLAVLGSLGHSLALYGVLEGLHLGLHVHVLDALSPAAQVTECAALPVGILYATPVQLRLLAAGAKARRLPDLRLILCGGGPLDAQTRTAVAALAPNAALHVFYGAAETSFITLSDESSPDGSAGRPYPGAEVHILDPAGQPTKGSGLVWVRSPFLFDSYLQGDSPDTIWRDGFLTVGEIGRMDADGNLWLEGRRSRMVTIADQSVYPEAVEAVIAGLPGVGACVVLPGKDARRGHHLVAVVEGENDAGVADAIRNACRKALGPLRTPRAVLFHPELPRLASGKPDLVALARWCGDAV